MNIENVLELLELRMKRSISFLPAKRRLYFEELKKRFVSRGILLCGPRGSGKTTFLLSIAQEENMFYISTDDPLVGVVPFYELSQHILSSYDGIIIDEIHFLKDWGIQLKSLYDSFPNKKIWISDSSSIMLHKSIAELSRRFVIISLPLMSLREFIHFETGKILPVITDPFSSELSDISMKILREVDVMKYFKSYKGHGTRPFYTEPNFKDRIMNIIQKSIYYDIPHIVGTLSENHFGVMNAIVSYLAYSKIPTINVESMCKEWRLSKEKLYQLLNAMGQVGLVTIVQKSLIESPYSKGAKIFFSDPVIYSALDGEIGNFREAFVVFALKDRGTLLAQKDETKGDYIFNNITLEIGGANKKRKQAHYVIRDDIDLPVRNAIPMWTLGMGW
jgi:hypothetical protein